MNYSDILASLESNPKYRAAEQRRSRNEMIEDGDRQWFAIFVAPQREFAVEALLYRQGIECFLPRETKFKTVIKKGRREFVPATKKVKSTGEAVPVVYAMFSRYIFVRKPFSWLHLMAERHVNGVVGFDGTPSAISDAEITKLKAMSGNSIPHKFSVNPHRALRVGELAEIAVGPFAGQIVKVEGLHGRRAKIFMNLFGARKEVEIGIENLEAA